MTFAAPSMLSLSAVGLYMVVLAACLLSAVMANKHCQPRAHSRLWLGIAIAFAVFALFRLAGLEEFLRDAFRGELRAVGRYDERRAIQAPFAATTIVMVTALFGWVFARQLRGTLRRRNFVLLVASASVILMILLLAMRIVSLHQIDSLLYGPAKLNWVIDIGVSIIVAVSAACYVRFVAR